MHKRIVVAALAITLVLSGGAIAVAQTATTAPATPEVAKPKVAPKDGAFSPKAKGRHGHGHGFGGGAIHSEVIVPVKPADGSKPDPATATYQTIEFDRGVVVTASDTSLTLKRPDGVEVTLKIDDKTSFKGVTKGSELAEGSNVMAKSRDGVALHIGQPQPGDRDGHSKKGPNGRGHKMPPSGDRPAKDAPAPA